MYPHPSDAAAQLAAISSAPQLGDQVIIIKTSSDGRRTIDSNVVTDQRGMAAQLEQVARELRDDDQRVIPGDLILPS